MFNADLPKISVVMPVLNRGAMIERAIRSVIDQAYPNVELIIIDGGSTDQTIDIIRQYESYITYWHSKPDGSPAAAFNCGVEKATGALIGFLMSDDWFEPGVFFEIAKNYLTQQQVDILICGGRIVSYDEETNQCTNLVTFMSAKKQRLTLKNACFNDSFAICCYFIKPTVFQRIGLFHPYVDDGVILMANDRDWVVRAALQQVVTRFVPYLGYTFRAHDSSMSFSFNKDTAIRHCREHQWMIKNRFLSNPLSELQRFILRCWYNEQSVRLMLLSLLYKKEKKLACQQGLQDFKEAPIHWTVMFVIILNQYAFKKLSQKFKKMWAN